MEELETQECREEKKERYEERFVAYEDGVRDTLNSPEVQNLVLALKNYTCSTTQEAIKEFEIYINSMKEPLLEIQQIPGKGNQRVS